MGLWPLLENGSLELGSDILKRFCKENSGLSNLQVKGVQFSWSPRFLGYHLLFRSTLLPIENVTGSGGEWELISWLRESEGSGSDPWFTDCFLLENFLCASTDFHVLSSLILEKHCKMTPSFLIFHLREWRLLSHLQQGQVACNFNPPKFFKNFYFFFLLR